MLDIPLYFVHGNHVPTIEDDEGNPKTDPEGSINLHKTVYYDEGNDLILAGIEGSLLYNFGPRQYSQQRMWNMVYGLVPRLLLNKVTFGRYLDVLVTHAAATGLHDDDDPAHQGVDAFRWLIDTFKPKLHLHGHIHIYNPLVPRETFYKQTRVINTYGYREITI
jgi:Icc-related predicted phosphoesterase